MLACRYYASIFFLLLSLKCVVSDEDNPPTPSLEIEEQHLPEDTYTEVLIDNNPEPAVASRPSTKKPRHHSKQKEHPDRIQSNRSPVYEVVSQPCYSPNCRGYDQYEPNQGSRWPQRGNRMTPYPQTFYDPRRRGMYPSPDYYPDGYYGPREPDYGYGSRRIQGYPSQGRYGGYGGYSQPIYGNGFLG